MRALGILSRLEHTTTGLKIIKKTLAVLLFQLFGTLAAQINYGLSGDYSFNSSSFVNDVNGKPIKASSAMFVDDRFGNPKSACFLQGTEGSYLNLGTEDAIKPKSGTISLWLNIERAALGGKGFEANPVILTKNLQKDDFFEAFVLAYNYDEGRICVTTSDSPEKQVHIRSANRLQLGKWHHYAFSFDNNKLKFYKDGELAGEVLKNFQTQFLPGDSVIVGSTANKKNDRYLLGMIDDIKIYNRVLSDNEISELYNLPNPNRFNRALKIIGAAFLVFLLAGVIILIVVKRSKKKLRLQEEKNRIVARMNELETRAIRMHMNPHFIFNSLNSLQRYILEADIEKAQTYLTRFSSLLRKILESSNSEYISLNTELEILTTYIEIEKVRFENSFTFEITADIADSDTINIPFMLVQPLVENSIWHGLLPKKGEKKLQINFIKSSASTVTCTIADNGVGLQLETENGAEKKPSQGLNFIRQRLEILQKITNVPCFLNIESIEDDSGNIFGTRVEITIPIID